jgi:hypothetical protein
VTLEFREEKTVPSRETKYQNGSKIPEWIKNTRMDQKYQNGSKIPEWVKVGDKMTIHNPGYSNAPRNLPT